MHTSVRAFFDGKGSETQADQYPGIQAPCRMVLRSAGWAVAGARSLAMSPVERATSPPADPRLRDYRQGSFFGRLASGLVN